MQGGNAQQGELTSLFDGVRPQHGDYNPMRLQGSIILGTGGDDSQGAQGVLCALHFPRTRVPCRAARAVLTTNDRESLRHPVY